MEKKSVLSARQQAVYDFIIKFCEEHSYPPTVREIGAAVGLKSTSNVHMHLKTLERKGYIRMDAAHQRTISVVQRPAASPEESFSIPIVDAAAAGDPVLAFEQVEGYLPLSPSLVQSASPRELFALKVEGESMAGAGILNGDLVIVHKGLALENGDIGVARASAVYGHAATVKRIFQEDSFIRLQSEHSAMEPIILPQEGVELIGKVVALFRRY